MIRVYRSATLILLTLSLALSGQENSEQDATAKQEMTVRQDIVDKLWTMIDDSQESLTIIAFIKESNFNEKEINQQGSTWIYERINGYAQGSRYTPLGIAVLRNNLDVTKALTEAKADINHNHDHGVCGWTPLMVALHNKSMSMIEFLMNSGADVNIKSSAGGTFFELAKQMKKEEREAKKAVLKQSSSQ